MIETMVKKAFDYDATIHLGDDYRDANAFVDAELSLIRVPGTWGTEYQDPMIENRRFEFFLGWTMFLSHTPDPDDHDLPDDLNPHDILKGNQCDVFFHGHTHEPKISQVNDVLVVNPGHLKSDIDRGQLASYAELDISKESLQINIIQLASGDCIASHTLNRDVS